MAHRLLLLLLFLCAVHSISAQDREPIPAWLVDPALQVVSLPDLLNAEAIPTELGNLRTIIDHENRLLLYQYDAEPIQVLPLPDALDTKNSESRITVAPDGRHAAICNLPFNLSAQVLTGNEFAIDLETKETGQFSICQFTRAIWGGVESQSWGVTSPDGRYHVSVTDHSFLCPSSRYAVMIQSASERHLGLCGEDWSQVRFIRWLDDDRLLLTLSYAQDSYPPIVETFILSMSTREAVSFGQSIESYNSGLIFYDDNRHVVRIKLQGSAVTRSGRSVIYGEPFYCALNSLNLETGQSVDLELTYCLREARIHINEEQRELLYLNHMVNEAIEPSTSTSTPHLVDLDTHEVSILPIEGIILDVLSITPDWNRFAFLVDNAPGAARGHIWSDANFQKDVNPRLVVYDRQQQKVIADIFLPLGGAEGIRLTIPDDPTTAIAGFKWSDVGWQLLLQGEDSSLHLIEAQDEVITETQLNGIPASEWYSADWSPSNNYLLVALADGRHFLVNLGDDQPLRQVTSVSEESLIIQWGEEDNTLLVQSSGYNQLIVQHWKITLPE